MRRKTLRLLADSARLALLGVGVTAAGTAAVWNLRPDLVDKLEDKLIRHSHGPYVQRWEAAKAAHHDDPETAERLLEALVADMQRVRRMDHLGEVVEDSYRRLSQLAERRGDLEGAVRRMRECVAFDGHSVHTQTRLGELLCRLPATRQEGVQHLLALYERFPGNRFVTPALCDVLIDNGLVADAGRLIAAADRTIRSNYWTASWDDGGGRPYRPRVGTIPQQRDGELTVRFEVATPVKSMRLDLPPFSSGVFFAPRLTIEAGSARVDIDLAAETAGLHQIRRGASRLTTWGESGPWLEVELPEPAPAGSMWTFRARFERAPAAMLTEQLLRPEMAQLFAARGPADVVALADDLRPMRALGTAHDVLQVFWCGPDDDAFAGARSARREADTSMQADGPGFAVALPLGGRDLRRLRLDLPEGQGLRYRLSRLQLVAAGGAVDLEVPTPLQGAHAVASRDGWIEVTGRDPYFALAVPPGAAAATALVVEGSVR